MWIDSNGSVCVVTSGDDFWAAANDVVLQRMRRLKRKELKALDRLVSEFWTNQVEDLEGIDFDASEEERWADRMLPKDVFIVDGPGPLIDVVESQLVATSRRWQIDLAQALTMVIGRIQDGE